MARYQKRESLIKTSLTSGWKFSAIVAVGSMLLTWVLIPILFFVHPILRLLIPAFQQLGLVIALIFASIAFIKLLVGLTNREKLNKDVYKSQKEKIEPRLINNQTAIRSIDADFLSGLSARGFNSLCESYFNQRGINATIDSSIAHDRLYLRLKENGSDTDTAIANCEVGSSFIGIVELARFSRVMKLEKIRRGYYITTSRFDQAAIDHITNMKIKLIDGEELLFLINALPESSRQQILLAGSELEQPLEKLNDSNTINPEIVLAEKAPDAKVATKWSIDLLNALEWKRFEELCSAYFTEIGIKNELTSLGADGGIDIKLYEDNSATVTCLVQCKSYSKPVGIKLIREFIGVMHLEKVDKGMFITTSKFHNAAISAAAENNIRLIDGDALMNLIRSLPSEKQDRLSEYATSGDFSTPTCVKCGLKMVRRKTEKKEFWGCRNYPRCRRTLWI